MTQNPQASEQFIVHVSDIPKDVTKEDILDYFKANMDHTPNITVLQNHWNKTIPTQWAKVDMGSKEKQDTVLDKFKFPVFKASSGIESRIVKNITDRAWLKDNSSNVVVRKLDKDTIDNSQLHQEFSKIGEVVCCKVSKTLEEADDKVECKSNGYGFVRFENEEIASKAISEYNGKKIGDL